MLLTPKFPRCVSHTKNRRFTPLRNGRINRRHQKLSLPDKTCICSVKENSEESASALTRTESRLLARSVVQKGEFKVQDKVLEENGLIGVGDLDGMRTRRDGRKGVKVMGLEPSPELFAISMVYFVQGIVSLSRLAMSFFLKDVLMQDPAQVALLESYGKFPWLIKPIYGFASDTIPLFGYRRRSYLVICGLLSASAWLTLSSQINTATGAVFMMVVASLGTACSDVVVDSIVVERARGEPQATAGSLQSLCWASAAVGGIISAYFSGYLVDNFGPRFVFASVAVFPLLVTASAVLVREDPVNSKISKEDGKVDVVSVVDGVSNGSIRPSKLRSQLLLQLKALWGAFSQKKIFFPAIFTFLWMATPSSSSAMFFYYTNELHFSPEFLGRVTLLGQIASLAGVGVYNTFLKEVPLRKMFLWTSLIGTGLGMTQLVLVTGLNRTLGLSDQLFVLGDSVILEVLGQLSFMPVLVLAARICPDGVEASLFALLMSILNGGSFTGQAIGAGLTNMFGVTSDDFTNLAPLVTVCVVSTLLPLPFLRLLPKSTDTEQAVEDEESKNSVV